MTLADTSTHGRCLCGRGRGGGRGCGRGCGCVATVEMAVAVNVGEAVGRGCGRSGFRGGSEGRTLVFASRGVRQRARGRRRLAGAAAMIVVERVVGRVVGYLKKIIRRFFVGVPPTRQDLFASCAHVNKRTSSTEIGGHSKNT